MVSIYVNNCGWVLGLDKQGKIHYTHFRDGAKMWPSEFDKEFVYCARQAQQQGHHIDKVHRYDIPVQDN